MRGHVKADLEVRDGGEACVPLGLYVPCALRFFDGRPVARRLQERCPFLALSTCAFGLRTAPAGCGGVPRVAAFLAPAATHTDRRVVFAERWLPSRLS
jgi:hypothetical protein